MIDIRNYSLLSHNTFGIDARCDRFVEFTSVDELVSLVGSLTDSDRPLLLLGGGSNLLLTGDYHGTVIHSAIKGIELVERDEPNKSVTLRVGSGEVFDDFVSYCVEHGFYGAENLSIIPGEVGASAVQNIGAYGVEAKDLIVKVEAVEIATGKIVEFSNEDCQYAYRYSRFKGEWRDQYV
ncbi:MAG: FAD-binding protein, partial [Prevotella sp.]|nr:FAD-binding protein [Prevotella sp.]